MIHCVVKVLAPCTMLDHSGRLFLGDTYPSLTGVGYMPFSSDHATWVAWTVIYILSNMDGEWDVQSFWRKACFKHTWILSSCKRELNTNVWTPSQNMFQGKIWEAEQNKQPDTWGQAICKETVFIVSGTCFLFLNVYCVAHSFCLLARVCCILLLSFLQSIR